jgi:hypothetical protein
MLGRFPEREEREIRFCATAEISEGKNMSLPV